MTQKMKTSELIGPALDWAVAKCEGHEDTEIWIWADGYYNKVSTDWSQGGPIIEREKIELIYYGNMGYEGAPWEAQMGIDTHYIDQYPGDATRGPTPLIAAMRCYVASKLGDEIEIPEELL
jgi:hypothetical protein